MTPIDIAGLLALASNGETRTPDDARLLATAARTIRDLNDLAVEQEKLFECYTHVRFVRIQELKRMLGMK